MVKWVIACPKPPRTPVAGEVDHLIVEEYGSDAGTNRGSDMKKTLLLVVAVVGRRKLMEALLPLMPQL